MTNLTWKKNEFGVSERWLYLGEIYVGEVHPHPDHKGYYNKWRAWFADSNEGNSIGIYDTIEEAKAAVMKKVKESVDAEQ